MSSVSIGRSGLLPAGAVLLFAVAGCSASTSQCKSDTRGTLRQAGKEFRNFEILGALVDVILLPVAATTDCARDVAASSAKDMGDRFERRVGAERVGEDDPRVKPETREPAPAPPPPVAATSPVTEEPLPGEKACDYRSSCVAASTLLVTSSRGSASGGEAHEYQQYALSNNCDAEIDCYVCATKAGEVVHAADGSCVDSNEHTLSVGKNWITHGNAPGVDGMSVTCLRNDGTGHAGCRTWPK
jgi:hypothetical protein